jgi:Alcohol dehydrogenase transcription factor Myb/SANT-like
LDPPLVKVKKEKKEKIVKTVRSDGKPMPDRLPRSFISEFIAIYKAHECLWKPQSPNYHNRKVKRLAWQKLIEKYREIEPNPNKKTVLRKIGSLRTTFRKEYTRVERAKNTWQPHKPKLWYYEQFSFIIVDPAIEDVTVKEDHKAIVEMKEEIDDDGEDEDENDQSQDDDDDDDNDNNECTKESNHSEDSYQDPLLTDGDQSLDTPKRETRKRTSEIATCSQPLKKLIVEEYAKDEHFLTGQTIAAKLKNMTVNQQIIAEKLIFDVLYYGRMEKLDMETSLQSLKK